MMNCKFELLKVEVEMHQYCGNMSGWKGEDRLISERRKEFVGKWRLLQQQRSLQLHGWRWRLQFIGSIKDKMFRFMILVVNF